MIIDIVIEETITIDSLGTQKKLYHLSELIHRYEDWNKDEKICNEI